MHMVEISNVKDMGLALWSLVSMGMVVHEPMDTILCNFNRLIQWRSVAKLVSQVLAKFKLEWIMCNGCLVWSS